MSFGVWISMKSFSTHQVRSACRKVVCTRKSRFCSGRRRSRKRQSRRLSTLESSAIGSVEGGAGDVERLDLHLEAAELDPLVVLELADDGEEGAGREGRDLLGDRVGRGLLAGVGARVDELDGAGLVAQHDELHLLLVAHRVDPSGDRHRPVGCGGEVLDEGAGGHGLRFYLVHET